MHELLPTASVMALLLNPMRPDVESQSRDLLSAAHALGFELHVMHASAEHDLDGIFAKVTQLPAGGLIIADDAFFTARQEQLGALSVRHALVLVNPIHS